MEFLGIVFCVFYITCAHSLADDGIDPVISITNGKIRGRKIINLHNETFFGFLEVPYASPPVGDLRFKEAVPPGNWNGILNTTKNTKICMETYANKTKLKPNENEDCLYANVYIPKYPVSRDKLLPVLIYIYGGQFAFNDGTLERYNPQLIVEAGVVSVVFNYRQGQLGFLTTADDVIPGNLGMKDQLRAFQWVQSNIQYFGGDPAKVTILGHSSGAVCVTYHVLSKRSAGLFRSAIIQSSTSLSSVAYQQKPRHYAYEYGKLMSPDFTNQNSTKELLELLKSLPAEKLALYLHKPPGRSVVSDIFPIWFPTIETEDDKGAFIVGPMHDNIRDGNFNRVPVMMGITSEEVLWYVEKAGMANWGPDLDRNPLFDNINIQEERKTEFAEKLRLIYTNSTFTEGGMVPIFRFLSDILVRVPVIRHADMQANYSDVYFYQFSYHGPRSETAGHSHPMNVKGLGNAGHAEDMKYLLDVANDVEIKYPYSDTLTSRRWVKLCTNFVKYMNPTPEEDPLLQNIIWPKLPTNNFTYLDINNNLTLLTGYPKEYGKWLPLIEEYYEHPLIAL